MKNFLFIFFCTLVAYAKEIALSFDDAPMSTTRYFDTISRTEELIRSLQLLKVPPVMIFANPCRRKNLVSVMDQLKKYKDAGHFIANHTCSHPDLDKLGYEEYSKDAKKADEFLGPLFVHQKFFRFPFLREGENQKLRNQMREWLKENQYRNGMVSIDTDDYIFSLKINKAKKYGKKFDLVKVQKLFIDHIQGAVNYYDDLALKNLGYSPKHVLLLHEMDATVLFLRPLIDELRKNGWRIISIEEAYKDNIYFEHPKNTYANNGIIAQLAFEKTGVKMGYNQIEILNEELLKILGIE